MGADHDQKAVDQIHWIVFEAFAAVDLSVAGCYYGDAGGDDCRQLCLCLDGLRSRKTVEALNDQKRPRRNLTVFNGF
ncbi:hypothetical protein D3C86_1850340 [compost metagenome]